MKQAEVKESMNSFLKEHSEYVSGGYTIGFFTKEKGLYSGVCKTQGKLYGFVIDFSNKSFFIEGITGKHLKENYKNLNTIFPSSELERAAKVSDTLKKLFRIGYMLGDYNSYLYDWGGRESINIGRGLLRAIKKFPIAEQLAAMPWSYSATDAMHSLIHDLNKKANSIGNGASLKKITGLSSGNFKLFSNAKSEFEAKNILTLGNEGYALIKQCSDIVEQVGKERGYHDSDTYIHQIIDYIKYSYSRENLINMQKSEKYEDINFSFTNMIRYLYFSCYHQQALGFRQALDILEDYWKVIPNSKGVSKYPRYLKTAHDVASNNYQVIKDFSKVLGVYDNYKKHSELEGICKNTAFIVAMTPSEISDEANQQSNCVAGYINSVSENKTTIMFMRDANNIEHSKVTFEIKDGTLIQAYATYDRPLDKEQSSMLLGYCKLMNIGWTKNLALDYSANPTNYKKLKELTDFHDTKAVNELEDKRNKEIEKCKETLMNNSAVRKTA